MAEGVENLARRCGAVLAAMALAAAAAAGGTAAAPAPVADGSPAPRAGEAEPVRPGAGASAAFAPGVPPSVAAALVPAAEPGGGERAGAVEGSALSVRISDDRDKITAGEEATYTLTLRNNSAEAAEAIVSQRLSAEARFVDVGADGIATGGVATWRVPIAAGAEARRRVQVRLDESGKRLWRVATTVCAQTEPDAPPVACATDANRVERALAKQASAVSAPKLVLTAVSILTAILIAFATVAAAIVVWHRIRPNQQQRE
ncbi:hypothetical protein GCM10027570_19800 [Streptomonospora sediminis]